MFSLIFWLWGVRGRTIHICKGHTVLSSLASCSDANFWTVFFFHRKISLWKQNNIILMITLLTTQVVSIQFSILVILHWGQWETLTNERLYIICTILKPVATGLFPNSLNTTRAPFPPADKTTKTHGTHPSTTHDFIVVWSNGTQHS